MDDDVEHVMTRRHCRLGSVHAAHAYLRLGSVWWCLGVEHDHEARCCEEHDHHTSPHKGCIFR